MKRFFDPEMRKIIVGILRLGCPRRAAANVIGCHVATIYNEEARDKEFAKDIKQAEASFELRHKQRIEAASEDIRHWRASAWSLERRFPEQYALRRPGTITQDHIERILLQFAQILGKHIPDDKERSRVIRKLSKATEPPQIAGLRKGRKHGKQSRTGRNQYLRLRDDLPAESSPPPPTT